MDDFFGSQARRGFVENDDARVVIDGAGDFHHLALGGAEQRHRRCRIDVEIEGLQELLRLDIEGAEAGDQLLIAEFDVLRRGHRRHQAGFLIDHADAGSERIARLVEIGGLAVNVIFA